MLDGSWLMAQGSWLMAKGGQGRLMAHGQMISPQAIAPQTVSHQSTGRMRSQIGSMDSYRKLPDCRPPTVGSQSSEWVPNSNIGSPGLWTADVGPLLQAPGRVRALSAPASLARDCSPPDWPAPAKVLSTKEEASPPGVCAPTKNETLQCQVKKPKTNT